MGSPKRLGLGPCEQGRGEEHLLRGIRQSRDAVAHERLDVVGHGEQLAGRHAALRQDAADLEGEERIAGRHLEEMSQRRAGQAQPELLGEDTAYGTQAKPSHVDPIRLPRVECADER